MDFDNLEDLIVYFGSRIEWLKDSEMTSPFEENRQYFRGRIDELEYVLRRLKNIKRISK